MAIEMNKFRKIAFALVATAGIGMMGYGVIASTQGSTLAKAGKHLSSTDKYIVSTVINTPIGSSSYLEVNTPSASYTEVPYNDGTNNAYVLFDWLTSDNKLYEVNAYATEENADKLWLSMPDNLGVELSGRKTMYAELLSKGLYDCKENGEKDLNLGKASTSKVKMYKGKIKSETVKELFKKDSYSLYSELKEQCRVENDKDSMNKVSDYMNQLDRNLTFSDAEFEFGIYDDDLVYWSLTTGGLGSSMRVTKQLIVTEFQLRETPDFSKVTDTYFDANKSKILQAIDNAENGNLPQPTQQPVEGSITGTEAGSDTKVESTDTISISD